MPKTDKSPLLLDMAVAFALLTRLPLPRLPDATFDNQARAAWAYALVGACVGAIAGGIGWLSAGVGLPTSAVAGLILLAQIMATGAMHEDGLADTADGLWGGATRERRLEIMKDSRIGTYGVVALIFSVGLRWVALDVLLDAGVFATMVVVIIAAAFSRALMPLVMAALPHARRDGLSRGVGRPGWAGPGVVAVLTVGLTLTAAGNSAVVPIALASICTALVAMVAKVKIGGQTGDILGTCQQVAEIVMLLGFAAVMIT